MRAGLWWQVWRCVGDRLNAGLLVIGDDRHGIARLLFGGRRRLLNELDLAVDAKPPPSST
jgi:hypothetical protein